MKRTLFSTFLFFIVFSLIGCQINPIKEEQNAKDKKIFSNTISVLISYDINSFVCIIKDRKEIQKLEYLFNNATYTKTDKTLVIPHLNIIFRGENESKSVKIDENNVLRLNDEINLKSKKISFKNLFDIYKSYSTQKK